MIRKIGAVESRDDRARVVERELPADIFTDFGSCRCGKCDGRRRAKLDACLGDSQIAGTKIMSLLADAMRFVDSEEAHADVPEPCCDIPEIESLGREIEKPDLASRSASKPVRYLR